MNYLIDKKVIHFSSKVQALWQGGDGEFHFSATKRQESQSKLLRALVTSFPMATAASSVVTAVQSCSSRPGEQEQQRLSVSTFLLSYRSSFITKSRDFLTCVVPVDGEKGVGGGCVKWGCLSAGKEVVDGDLCGPREL